MIAKVAVENMPFFAGGTYDYAVPEHLRMRAKPGARVVVPFGRDRRAGFILSLCDQTAYVGKLRAIATVAEDDYLVPEEMLALAQFMSEQYITPVYDCLKTMLPAGLEMKTEALYRLGGVPAGSDEELVGCVREREPVSEKILLSLFGDCRATLRRLCEQGVLVRSFRDKRSLGDRTVPTVHLCCTQEQATAYCDGKVNERARGAVEFLLAQGETDKTDLCYMTGVTPAMLTTLKKNGIIAFGRREVRRMATDRYDDSAKNAVLSPDQQKIADDIGAHLGEFGVDLLYGVTGSGKTHVFYDLLDRVLERGESAIVMVPEIMLTVQLTARLRGRYGDTVAVMHSDLSPGARLDEWKRMKEGQARIAVGTRTAVFAPFDKIGLIILDEEQEHTYKSELSPKFHAKSVAIRRALHHRCPVLLSSATPSIESRSLAQSGKYRFHVLPGRFNGAGAPPTKLIDMRHELREGNTAIFSRTLQKEIAENLVRGEQSILFINRRGFNTFISCRSCGHAMACPHCSIGMTYHIKNNRLMCHYCGHSEPVPTVCPECGSEHIRFFGTGTQKAELELQALFPQARILRMDADTTAGRLAHEQLLAKFDSGEYDILLGTQMVTKGLDFPKVTLVGILAADASLYSDDYRAGERTFSLITQVIGRAGRSALPGRAVIQTYSPDHEVLSLGLAQDYDGFYNREIALRKLMLYPPYSDLCQLVFSGEDPKETLDAADAFKEAMMAAMTERKLPMSGIGPAPCRMAKVGGRYRFRLLIKCRASADFRAVLRAVLEQNKTNKRIFIDADINPYNLQ